MSEDELSLCDRIFRLSYFALCLHGEYRFTKRIKCMLNMFCTSVQIQCDTHIYSLNGLCVLLYFSLELPPDILCDAAAKPSPLYHEVLLLLKLFISPSRTGGCVKLKRQSKSRQAKRTRRDVVRVTGLVTATEALFLPARTSRSYTIDRSCLRRNNRVCDPFAAFTAKLPS